MTARAAAFDRLPIETIATALSYVPAHDREVWVRMAMAIKDELGEAGKQIWIDWSATDKSFHPADADQVWKSVRAGGSGRVGIGSLIQAAKDNGYDPKTRPHRISDEELQERVRRREEEAERERLETERRHARAAGEAEEIFSAASPDGVLSHPYIVRKSISAPGGVRVGRYRRWFRAEGESSGSVVEVSEALLIPLRDADRKLTTLQAIFPSDANALSRDRDYLPGGRKHGCYFVIGTIRADSSVVMICEGYATGCSLHQATGFPVVVAFDAGNVPEIARIVRSKVSSCRIVLAADNDKWHEDPSKPNSGVKKAAEAAALCSGLVAIPRFKDESSKPTDFNDLAIMEGEAEVKAQIDAVLAGKMHTPDVKKEPAKKEEAKKEEPEKEPTPPANDNTQNEASGFTILGYDKDTIYIFPHEAKQIRSLSKSDLSETGLLSIAPRDFWQIYFPKPKSDSGFDKSGAVDWIFRRAYERGVFNPDRIRGRGAWKDGERIVFHLGDRLHVDGVYTPITQLRSPYIYQAERPFPRFDDVPPISSEEGGELLELAGMFRWSVPASAALLAGWCVLAPVCGALRWRPHIWITGGPGSGKSTVIDRYVQTLIGDLSVFAQGNSSEAGLRQTLRGDAMPVLFDESEQNNDRETARMQAVLSLIRQSSSESGAKTYKGTQSGSGMHFHIRSMFCLASIQVGIQQQADRERLTVLSLREKPEGGSGNGDAEQWQKIKAALYKIERDPSYPRRLLHRTVSMMPTILESIGIFTEAAAEFFGNQRTGDQYGTLLAGAWCLVSDTAPTKEEAINAVSGFDWNEYTEPARVNDSDRAMQTLLDSRVRTMHGAEYTVFEILDRIADLQSIERSTSEQPVCNMDMANCNGALQRYGMKAVKGHLMLANNSEALAKVFAGSQFSADFRGLLARVKGVRNDGEVARINGKAARCLSIALADLV